MEKRSTLNFEENFGITSVQLKILCEAEETFKKVCQTEFNSIFNLLGKEVSNAQPSSSTFLIAQYTKAFMFGLLE